MAARKKTTARKSKGKKAAARLLSQSKVLRVLQKKFNVAPKAFMDAYDSETGRVRTLSQETKAAVAKFLSNHKWSVFVKEMGSETRAKTALAAYETQG